MTLGRLIFRNTVRHPVRLGLTVGGLAMVVLAFGLIRLTLDQWQAGSRAALKNRLITVHAMSDQLRLPLAYKDRLAVIPGVRTVHFGSVFDGVYQDPKQSFASYAEQAATFFETYPEVVLSDAERLDFQQDRRGCIIGRQLAARFGWKVGDAITLKGTVYPGDWELVVRGIFRSTSPNVMGEGELYLHWSYANERLKTTEPDRVDQVGWYMVRVAEGSGAQTVAAAIDAGFANSAAETRTEPEQAYFAGWVARSGALLRGLEWMSGVINGIALLVLVNALAMAVRERTREYAVIKTIGFQPRHLVMLVLGESLLLALCGGGLGLGLLFPAAQLYAVMTQDRGSVVSYLITSQTIGACFAVMLVVGLLAAVWPAVRLIRMTTLEGLRHAG